MSNETDKLLRECIRGILQEQDITFGYGFDFVDTFVEPFSDAAKVIKGEISKISTRAQSAVASISASVFNLLVPGLDIKINKIKNYEQKRLREIESDPDYKQAWEKVKPFAADGAKKMFFMFDPVGFITTEIAAKSPRAAFEAVDTLLAGVPREVIAKAGKQTYSRRRSKEYSKIVKKLLSVVEGKIQRFRIVEGKVTGAIMQSFLEEPEIQQILKSSPLVKKVRDVASEMASESAKIFVDEINEILSANSLDEIEQIFGSVDTTSMKELEGESGKIETTVLARIKQEVRKKAIEMMGNHLEEVGLKGNEDHPYHKIMAKAIESLVPSS